MGSVLILRELLILLWKIRLFIEEVFLLFLFGNELLNFFVLVSFGDFLFDYMLWKNFFFEIVLFNDFFIFEKILECVIFGRRKKLLFVILNI